MFVYTKIKHLPEILPILAPNFNIKNNPLEHFQLLPNLPQLSFADHQHNNLNLHKHNNPLSKIHPITPRHPLP